MGTELLVYLRTSLIIIILEESRNRPAVDVNRPAIQRTELPPSSENWDDESEASKANPYIIPGLDRSKKEVKEEDNENPKEKRFHIKSNIEIQCMQPAERKKYYKELADRARNKEMPDLTHKTRTIKY